MLLLGSIPGVSNAGYAKYFWYGCKECATGHMIVQNHLVLSAFSLVCIQSCACHKLAMRLVTCCHGESLTWDVLYEYL